MSAEAVPRQQINADLRALGVRPGDVLMVHASLRAMGPVEGGAAGVLDAIQEAIGPGGTMLVVLGARDDWAWVNDRPEAERPALLADAEPFDARSTPADPEVGTLAEVFRRRPGTRVSDHPEGRFGAAGPLAEALLSEVPWDDYFGAGSPLERLVQARGRVLRLGADMDTTTLLHYAEYLVPIEPKRRVRRHRLVGTPDGPAIRVVDTLDDSEGIVAYPAGRDYFEDLLRDYLAAGRAREGTVGAASSQLIDAADLVDYGVAWMLEHLDGRRYLGSARELTERLRADLLAARRDRRLVAGAAIGSLLAAVSNAEAVPVAPGPYRVVEGSAEAPRRELAPDEIMRIVLREIRERRAALGEYRRIGADTARLEEELATIERYLPPP